MVTFELEYTRVNKIYVLNMPSNCVDVKMAIFQSERLQIARLAECRIREQ